MKRRFSTPQLELGLLFVEEVQDSRNLLKKKQRIINQVYNALRTIFLSWYVHMIFFYICHLRIHHNTPCLFFHSSIFVYNSHWVQQVVQRQIKGNQSFKIWPGIGSLLCRDSRRVSQLINIASFLISLHCEQFLFCSKICERVIVSLRNRRVGRQGRQNAYV